MNSNDFEDLGKRIIGILDASDAARTHKLASAFALSVMLYGGLLREAEWKAVIKSVGCKGALQTCRQKIWLNYTVAAGATPLGNMRNITDMSIYLEERWHPDNVSLALLLLLVRRSQDELAEVMNSLSWASIAAEFSIDCSYSDCRDAIAQNFFELRRGKLSPYLVKITTGEYSTVSLDHQRHRVFETGIEENCPTRRLSVSDGESDLEPRSDKVFHNDIKLLKQALPTRPSINRSAGAKRIRTCLPQLSPAGQLLGQWLIYKLERKDIQVSTAHSYVNLAGSPLLTWLDRIQRGICDEFGVDDSNLSTRINGVSAKLANDYQAENKSDESQRVANQVLNDLYGVRNRRTGVGAKFVNAARVNNTQLHALLSAGNDELSLAAWYVWLTILNTVGLRESELFPVRADDVVFRTSGEVELHIHRIIKTLNANRIVFMNEPLIQLWLAIRKSLSPQQAPMLMPLGRPSNKHDVSRIVNSSIRKISRDADRVAHSFRHSVASSLFESIVRQHAEGAFGDQLLDSLLDELAEDMGHGHIRTTLAHYIHSAHECIAERLNQMVPALKPSTMRQLLGEHYQYHQGQLSEREFQRQKLITAFKAAEAVVTLGVKKGRPAQINTPVTNIGPELPNLMIGISMPDGPLPKAQQSLKEGCAKALACIKQYHPNLCKFGTEMTLPMPRSPDERRLFEHGLWSVLQAIECKRLKTNDLKCAIECYEQAGQARFTCSTTQQAKQVIAFIDALGGAEAISQSNHSIEIRLIADDRGLRLSDWRRFVTREQRADCTFTRAVLSIQMSYNNRSSTAMRPLLMLFALHCLSL
ncbi:site-specific integrase [Neiella marina]|uniref:Site-specific integrase n=1 Tax=Neiella holothuriorum TaxID=2870530 RepID=A0ABS7EGW1_9GAMM|nr:site-specific integrase [Neiella holothuriorum]MBW8191435.1 site-specific integrase [Neiella holothuriorum]